MSTENTKGNEYALIDHSHIFNIPGGVGYPDYSRVVENIQSPYTAPEDGWICIAATVGRQHVIVNGVTISESHDYIAEHTEFPLRKGDIVEWEIIEGSTFVDKFIPMLNNTIQATELPVNYVEQGDESYLAKVLASFANSKNVNTTITPTLAEGKSLIRDDECVRYIRFGNLAFIFGNVVNDNEGNPIIPNYLNQVISIELQKLKVKRIYSVAGSMIENDSYGSGAFSQKWLQYIGRSESTNDKSIIYLAIDLDTSSGYIAGGFSFFITAEIE